MSSHFTFGKFRLWTLKWLHTLSHARYGLLTHGTGGWWVAVDHHDLGHNIGFDLACAYFETLKQETSMLQCDPNCTTWVWLSAFRPMETYGDSTPWLCAPCWTPVCSIWGRLDHHQFSQIVRMPNTTRVNSNQLWYLINSSGLTQTSPNWRWVKESFVWEVACHFTQ